MDAVPLLRHALDQAPPPDTFKAAVLQNQFELLGFNVAADRLDNYQRLRLLSLAMPPPLKEAATLREVVTGPSVEPAMRAAVARINADAMTVTFPADADRASAPQLQMTQQGLEHIERLAPGMWGLFKGRQSDSTQTADRAVALYLIADLRNQLAAKADLRVQYQLQPNLMLNCEASDVPAGDHRGGLCQVSLTGSVRNREGIRWIALAPEQKTAVYDSLLALRQTGAPTVQALNIRLDELHLTVDNTTGATFDPAWRAAATSEARLRLQAAPCDMLGTCVTGLVQQLGSPAVIHAGLTLLVMLCLIAYRFRRGSNGRLWPSAAKLYVLLVVLAIAINVADRPSGATRGAPLTGTLGFLAKVTVSMPWSYYFISETPDSGPLPGVLAKTLAEDSPWFWTFASLNLVFLLLMAAGGEPRKRLGDATS